MNQPGSVSDPLLEARPLSGRVALVTGASQGIGRAVAHVLCGLGARVALVARRAGPLEELAQELAPSGLALPFELKDAASGSLVVERAQQALGPLHILVHAAAGMFPMQRVMTLGDEEIGHSLQTELGSVVGMCRAAVPSMLGHRWGRIICLGSLAGSLGASGSTLYAAEKAGLAGLMRALAVDHGRHGITANTVSVAFCSTPRFEARTTPESRERFAAATALRRIPSPQDVAQVVGLLCRNEAGIITGSTLDATAGAHLNTLW